MRYSLREEWRYVNGLAQPKQGCTPGDRDQLNEGKTPQDFLKLINDVIRQRREAGCTLRPESHAFLTLDEVCVSLSPRLSHVLSRGLKWSWGQVLAVRLFSGPSYQPINAFLRQLGALSQQVAHRLKGAMQFSEVTYG